MALQTAGVDDDEDGLDPRIKDYLKQQMGASLAERSPAYQASLRADAGDAAAQKRSNNLSALLASSAAKFGTVGGKTADSSDYDRFAQNQNKGIDQDQAAMTAQNAQADAIDPRIMQYLARSDQNKARQSASAQRDAEFKQNLASVQQGRADSNDLKRTLAQSAAETKKAAADAATQKAQDAKDAKDSVDEEKGGRKNDEAYRDMIAHEAAARGDPATQVAGRNLLSISAAKDLINQYKNADDMPEAQYNLLVAELSKIASGGVGSQHGQDAIAQKTLLSELQKGRSFFGGGINGAQLGVFIKENGKYLDSLQKTNQAQLDKHMKANYGGYENLIGADNQAKYKREHPDLFAPPTPASDAPGPAPVAGSGVANAAPVGAKPVPAAAMPVGATMMKDGVPYKKTAQGWVPQ